MTTRYQRTLAFLRSPAVTLRTEEERLGPWEEDRARLAKGFGPTHRITKEHEARKPTPRTPADTEAILDRLARRPADYYQTDTNPHAGDAFRADLLVKAMDRPDYWTPAAAAKRLAAFRPSPGCERVK
jgi:hypothetical protein